MRWIFFMLLALNVLPAVLASNPPAEGEPGDAQSGKGIFLLSEAWWSSWGGNNDVADEPHCFAVGPFVSPVQASKLESAMVENGIVAKRLEREVESGWDYWVYIPPPPSARATARLLEELKGSGIESFLIADGELEGAIAIGIFADEAGAQERHAALSSLGYDLQIYRMQRWAREYWLLAEEIPGDGLWREVLKDFPDGAVREKIYPRACKTVASTMRFQ